MLTHLRIKNVALIDELEVEFGAGLNLLTGETGSGKSIIVDSLGALLGDRVSADLIKQGSDAAEIEGIFATEIDEKFAELLEEGGIDAENRELIIRREISASGRNRVVINSRSVTQGFLKQLGSYLADIHGQGAQAELYDIETHISILDDFAANGDIRQRAAAAYDEWSSIKTQLASLQKDESEKLQLFDILRFQADEIRNSNLGPGEDLELEDERLRLNNIEKLSTLSSEAYSLLYDDENSTLSTLDRAAKLIGELAGFDGRFRGFDEDINAARAVVEDLGSTARDFNSSLESSPERLNEIEDRLAEITRLKRKYGGSLESVLSHLSDCEERTGAIENAEFREEELKTKLAEAAGHYERAASELTRSRRSAAAEFESTVEAELKTVALEKARFEVRIESNNVIAPNGSDAVEFYFSANPGELPRPLARIASGGEASRLMLILKTCGRAKDRGKTAVFDEIDIGIGGRVAEAVGRKLKHLASSQQVFCVTHQPQIASLADSHFLVEKSEADGRTTVTVRELTKDEKIDEIARMLAGEQITDAARENARAMLASAK